MAPAQSEAFQKAIVDSKKLLKKPSNEELLELYGKQHSSNSYLPSLLVENRSEMPPQSMLTVVATGLFKVGTGEDITKAEAPGMFDLKVTTALNRPSRAPFHCLFQHTDTKAHSLLFRASPRRTPGKKLSTRV